MMPTYEFRCEECKCEWEDFLSVSAPIPICTKCTSNNVIRLISCTHFVMSMDEKNKMIMDAVYRKMDAKMKKDNDTNR